MPEYQFIKYQSPKISPPGVISDADEPQNSVSTPLCKIIPACFNFRGLAPASLSNQPQPAKSAIFGKIGGKMINLAGTFLHNPVE